MSEYILEVGRKNDGWARKEPIVRCRDCTWLVETSNPISSTGWWCVTNDTPRELDGFCNWAIRRAD